MPRLPQRVSTSIFPNDLYFSAIEKFVDRGVYLVRATILEQATSVLYTKNDNLNSRKRITAGVEIFDIIGRIVA